MDGDDADDNADDENFFNFHPQENAKFADRKKSQRFSQAEARGTMDRNMPNNDDSESIQADGQNLQID